MTPPKPLYAAFDNKDDRAEVHRLLCRLSPEERLAWLAWCCQQCKTPAAVGRSTGLAMEVYFDWWSLVNDYQLDPDKGLACLVEFVRQPGGIKRLAWLGAYRCP